MGVGAREKNLLEDHHHRIDGAKDEIRSNPARDTPPKQHGNLFFCGDNHNLPNLSIDIKNIRRAVTGVKSKILERRKQANLTRKI